MTRESIDLEADAVDSSFSGTEPWWILAHQLKQDLASIILMSEADLQVPWSTARLPCSAYIPIAAISHFFDTYGLPMNHWPFLLCA